MAIRPPRSAFSVSRRMSERARAAAKQETGPETGSAQIPGLAGIAATLKGLVEQFAIAAQAAQDDVGGATGGKDGHTFELGGKNARVVFGYSMRMGPDGVKAEPFGNVPAGSADPVMQPITEVFEDGAHVLVVAEIPGVDASHISCKSNGTSLLIETTGPRRYRKDLPLPVRVDQAGIVQSYRNGILEVRLERERP